MNRTSPAPDSKQTSPMPDLWFAVPGDLETPTGGYAYARRLMQALPATGWQPRHLALPGGFPAPTAVELEETRRLLSALPPDAPVLFDGLAFGALPRGLLEGLPPRWIALVHHPLAEESGLPPQEAARLRASERDALTLARRVVVTSPFTARTLARDYGVPPDRITVALPGTDPVPRARGSGAAPRLLSVATLTYRKGHDLLLRALADLRFLPWDCLLVGSLERDPITVAKLRQLIPRLRLEARVRLAGALSERELAAAYDAADLFVLPSRYEGYGMAFAEALAHGLPIVACAAGAVGETVPAEAARLAPAEDVESLRAALEALLTDPALRRRLGEAAWTAGQSLPGWHDTAAAVAAALNAA